MAELSPRKSSLSSPNLYTSKPKSTKSVSIIAKPAVRYFDSERSIISDQSVEPTVSAAASVLCEYCSSLNLLEKELDSELTSNCTKRSSVSSNYTCESSDYYFPSDETKCKVLLRVIVQGMRTFISSKKIEEKALRKKLLKSSRKA